MLPGQHVKRKLVGGRVDVFKGEQEAGQGLGVGNDVILKQLVEQEEGLLPHEQVDQKLVQKMLQIRNGS